MDSPQALGLVRHLLEGLCEARLDPISFARRDHLAYLRLCDVERQLLHCEREGRPAPTDLLRRVERLVA